MTTVTRVLPAVPDRSTETAILPLVEADLDAATEAGVASAGGIWEVDLDRCVVEANLRIGRFAFWRARLKVIDARLVLPPRDADGIADCFANLRATLSVVPAYASVPLSKRLFLRAASRSQRITVLASGLPRSTPRGVVIEADAAITTDTGSWVSKLGIRLIPVDERTIVLDVQAVVSGNDERPFGRTRVHFEAAAEFSACD